MSIQILIADDHEIVREGLRRLFADTDIQIVDEAETKEDAVRLALAHPLDAVLLDLSWRDDAPMKPDGFSALAQIKAVRPDLPVIVYTLHDKPSFIQRCRELGADGYIVKGTSGADLLAAVRSVSAGKAIKDGE